MRFEIRSGGIAAILVGLALLSGAVFVLGLLAGYNVGRESQVTTAQVATAYPMQAPPAAAQNAMAAVSAATPAAVETSAAAATPSEAANPATEPEAPASGVAKSGTDKVSAHEPAAVAESALPSAGASPSTSGEEVPNAPANPGLADGSTAASEPAGPHGSRHKPYNIQIRAAMDLNGGNAMMKRLEQLGYQAHLVPTQIASQTWYRVEVGPYASQQEAAAAEAELRQKYNAMYGGGRPAQAQATGGQPAQSSNSGQPAAASSN